LVLEIVFNIDDSNLGTSVSSEKVFIRMIVTYGPTVYHSHNGTVTCTAVHYATLWDGNFYCATPWYCNSAGSKPCGKETEEVSVEPTAGSYDQAV
jgi:hypothetical protein